VGIGKPIRAVSRVRLLAVDPRPRLARQCVRQSLGRGDDRSPVPVVRVRYELEEKNRTLAAILDRHADVLGAPDASGRGSDEDGSGHVGSGEVESGEAESGGFAPDDTDA
jgi:hypothetical protein